MTLAANDVQIVVRIPASVVDQLDRIASMRKVKRSVVVRWAIDEYAERFFSPASPLKETKDRPVDKPLADTPAK